MSLEPKKNTAFGDKVDRAIDAINVDAMVHRAEMAIEARRRELLVKFTAAAISALPASKWEPQEAAKLAVAIAVATIDELAKVTLTQWEGSE